MASVRKDNDATFERAELIIIDGIAPIDGFRSAYDQLGPTERIFVDAYVALGDPYKAVLEAFPNLAHIGPTGRSAAAMRALEYAKRPLIQAAIRDKLDAKLNKWELTQDRVLAELAKLSYSNLDDYLTEPDAEGNRYVDLSNVPRDLMAAVKSLKVEEYTEGRGEGKRQVRKTTFELHDKLGALDKAMKRLGLYAPEQIDHTSNGQTIGQPAQNTTNVLVIDQQMSAAQAAEQYARSLADDD